MSYQKEILRERFWRVVKLMHSIKIPPTWYSPSAVCEEIAAFPERTKYDGGGKFPIL